MKIFAIESSCDDTSFAVIDIWHKDGEIKTVIHSHITASQASLHTQYGGVFPALAKQEHMKALEPLLAQVLAEYGEALNNLDYIAVTYGPGLEMSLWVGIGFAEELSKKLGVPIIPTNHMEGHLLSSLLPSEEQEKEITLRPIPQHAISLLVSGGHTQLVEAKPFDYKILGKTKDDAVGEAFDKVARMLDLPYPGGPQISALAESARNSESITYNLKHITLPRPMLNSPDFDFSFSGLKTAVLYYIRDLTLENNNTLTDNEKISIAKEFEDAAIEVIVKKTTRSIQETGANVLLLGGGVAANKHLQKELAKSSSENNFTIYEPVRGITGDNALMIALTAGLRVLHNIDDTNIQLKANGKLSL